MALECYPCKPIEFVKSYLWQWKVRNEMFSSGPCYMRIIRRWMRRIRIFAVAKSDSSKNVWFGLRKSMHEIYRIRYNTFSRILFMATRQNEFCAHDSLQYTELWKSLNLDQMNAWIVDVDFFWYTHCPHWCMYMRSCVCLCVWVSVFEQPLQL